MLSKAQLTSYSRMSGSRWVITPSWLSWSWRSFLYSYFVYSWHLFLISSASVRSIPFLSFIEPIFAWSVPLVSLIFLKRSQVFLILLFSLFLCIDLWGRLSYLFLQFFGTLHSDAYIFPFLHCCSLLFFSQLVVKPAPIAILLVCISFLYCVHLCMKCSLGISYFLQDISSLSHSFVFLYFFALKRAFLSLLANLGTAFR